MIKKYFSLVLLFVTTVAFGQMETNWWYFGYGGGLNFTSGSPAPAPGSPIATSEGSSSVSDPITGNLLFYSDGQTVYDATHTPMPNGLGLLGGSSSTQSCLIVPQPGSTTLFYVFTTSELFTSVGMAYSVVDMTLNGGLGDVTSTKNVILFPHNSEQLAATKHANCIDWWIMGKELDNDVYHAYLLTSGGLGPAVTSTIGLPFGVGTLTYGQAKFTPDGTKFAIAAGDAVIAQLFNFDNSTGLLSSPITLLTSATGPGEDLYGLSFSGDNSKLYLMRGASATDLWQYDVSSGVAATVLASATLIATTSYYNQMQLARDFKIYVANSSGGSTVSVINNPNVAGIGCGFSSTSVPIAGISGIGICNFPDSYFNQVNPCMSALAVSISNSPISCNGDADANAWVNISSGFPPFTIAWSPVVSSNDTIYNLSPGTYYVTVTDSVGTVATDSVVITAPAILTVNASVAPDTVCQGSSVTFSTVVNGGTIAYHYQWSTSASDTLATNSETPASSGYVSVDVTDAHGCTASDSAYVTVLAIPQITSSNDTCICAGASLTITASGTPTYSWNTGASTASITVTPAGNFDYIVSYSNGVCSTSDTTSVCVNPVPTVSIALPDSVCAGTSVTFSSLVASGTSPFTYAWSGIVSGATANVNTASPSSGTETINITDVKGCTASANVSLTVLPVPNISAPADTCICNGASLTLTASGTPGYNWSTGDNTATITVTPPATGTYTYTVSYTNGVCSDTDAVVVCVNPVPVVIASNDTLVEFDHPVTIHATGTGPFDWSPSNSLSCTPCNDPEAAAQESTTYVVMATNAFGCSASDQVTVSIYYVIIIPNIITPNGDGLNDNFRIVGLPPSSALHIYNRWGNLMYETESYNNQWSHNSDGVYYYVLTTPDGKNFNGFFHVTGN